MKLRPETISERNFVQIFGADLKAAWEWINRYTQNQREPRTANVRTSGFGGMWSPTHAKRDAENDLHEAWDIYCNVFRRIKKQIEAMRVLELQVCQNRFPSFLFAMWEIHMFLSVQRLDTQYVSPKLVECKDLDLAVPGTFQPGTTESEIIRIGRFLEQVQVLQTKQKPRRISIFGNDGIEYKFLLKGHEDLRQDERVMQLFGLVNALLAANRHTPVPENLHPNFNWDDLKIERYAVIPLSENVGLIEWVPECDTLHSLIMEYRGN